MNGRKVINIPGKIGRGANYSNAHAIELSYQYNGSGPSAFGGAEKWPVVKLEISFQEGEEAKRAAFVRRLVGFLESEGIHA